MSVQFAFCQIFGLSLVYNTPYLTTIYFQNCLCCSSEKTKSGAMVCGNMEVESSKSYIDNLYDNHEDKVGSAVVTLKNAVIGSQKQKDTIIEQGVLARLIHLLVDPDIPTRIKTDVVYILGSITNGSEANLKSLNDADVVAILLNGLVSQDEGLVQVKRRNQNIENTHECFRHLSAALGLSCKPETFDRFAAIVYNSLESMSDICHQYQINAIHIEFMQ